MGDLLTGIPIGQVGVLGALLLTPWALLAFAVRRIVTGELVARQQLIDTMADRDYWRAAHDTQQQIGLKQGMTLERLLTLAETGNHVMTQIQAGLHQPRSEDR